MKLHGARRHRSAGITALEWLLLLAGVGVLGYFLVLGWQREPQKKLLKGAAPVPASTPAVPASAPATP